MNSHFELAKSARKVAALGWWSSMLPNRQLHKAICYYSHFFFSKTKYWEWAESFWAVMPRLSHTCFVLLLEGNAWEQLWMKHTLYVVRYFSSNIFSCVCVSIGKIRHFCWLWKVYSENPFSHFCPLPWSQLSSYLYYKQLYV